MVASSKILPRCCTSQTVIMSKNFCFIVCVIFWEQRHDLHFNTLFYNGSYESCVCGHKTYFSALFSPLYIYQLQLIGVVYRNCPRQLREGVQLWSDRSITHGFLNIFKTKSIKSQFVVGKKFNCYNYLIHLSVQKPNKELSI